ncbi:MAG TPA: molybdate ABC transporter substrate-binding protein [Acidisarcina sp.]
MAAAVLAGTLFPVLGSAAEPVQSLRIAAAADLEPLLPGVIAEFKQVHAGLDVSASYQSSATLATQIVNGAPFDLFLAADLSFPQRVIAAGLGDATEPTPYARGTLVLWARKDSRFQPVSMAALQAASLKSVAMANPEHAPYGRAAKAAIANLGLAESLGLKVVVAENIAQAAQFVDSGNAELGFISLTAALSERLKADGTFVEVPANAYPAILQGAVVIKGSANVKLARDFLAYLLSPAVQRELAAGGLKAPGGATSSGPQSPAPAAGLRR